MSGYAIWLMNMYVFHHLTTVLLCACLYILISCKFAGVLPQHFRITLLLTCSRKTLPESHIHSLDHSLKHIILLSRYCSLSLPNCLIFHFFVSLTHTHTLRTLPVSHSLM